MESLNKNDYLKELKKRSAQNRVTQNFQLVGLEVATILRDLEHKSLYIKLAKQYGADRIRVLAKDVADRRNIKNPGAYFMTLIKEMGKNTTK